MGKKVGEINYTPIILVGAIGLGIYLLWDKISAVFGGSAANAANNDALTAGQASSVNTDIATQTAAGGLQTISNAEASGIAAQIYSLGISGNPVSQSNQDRMVTLMIMVNTPLDLLTIEKYFGTKQADDSFFSSCNLLGTNCRAYDLASWLGATLDFPHLNKINNFYSAQQIGQQF